MITLNFTCKSPLSHGGFGPDPGNASPLRREPVVSLPGRPLVPVVSANALRGVMRRYLARELFAVTGVGPDTAGWDRLYAALANGGTLESPEKRLEPDRIRKVREALPAISVLGAWFYKWGLSGHLRPRGFVWPICRETVEGGLVIPLDGEELLPAEELVTESSFVRLPDVEEARPEDTGVKPMPVTFEALATGTRLQVTLDFAKHAPAIERAAILHAAKRLTHLGARGAGGMGYVEVQAEPEGDLPEYEDWLTDDELLAGARDALLWLPSTWGEKGAG